MDIDYWICVTIAGIGGFLLYWIDTKIDKERFLILNALGSAASGITFLSGIATFFSIATIDCDLAIHSVIAMVLGALYLLYQSKSIFSWATKNE